MTPAKLPARVLVILCVILARPALADLTFHMDGEVTQFINMVGSTQSNLAMLGVQMNAPVAIDWSVDPNASFIDYPTTFSRLYSSGAITSFTIKIGSWTATGSDARGLVTNRIQVSHGQGNDRLDTYYLFRSAVDDPNDFITGNDPNGQIELRFDDFAGKGNTGLGLDQQTPSQFGSMVGSVSGVNGQVVFGLKIGGSSGDPTVKCRASQLAAAGALCKATFGCLARNAKNPLADPNDLKLDACRASADTSFGIAFDKAAAAAAKKHLSCGTSETAATFLSHFDAGVDDVLAVAATISPPAPALLASWYTAAGAMCSVAAKAEAKNISKPSPTSLDQARATARAKLTAAANKAIAKAESKGVTFDPAPDVAAFVAKIDALIDDLVSEVDGP